MTKKMVIPAPPREVVRWLQSLVENAEPEKAAAPTTRTPAPRVGYSLKGRVPLSKLTPRARQVAIFLKDHKGATASDVEKFLISKADVPKAAAPNAFRGAMARLRKLGLVEAKPRDDE